jgi:hypothetical protein
MASGRPLLIRVVGGGPDLELNTWKFLPVNGLCDQGKFLQARCGDQLRTSNRVHKMD